MIGKLPDETKTTLDRLREEIARRMLMGIEWESIYAEYIVTYDRDKDAR